MSTSAQVAVLRRGGRRASPPRLLLDAGRQQPAVRLVTFAALGLYGVLRWSTLLSGGINPRLLGLLALAVAVAAVGVLGRRRLLTVLVGVLAVLAAFAVAGVPVSWVVGLRVAVTARAIGDGIAALPRATVPYVGINPWVRTVNLLGAAVLLLDAALLLAFSARVLGDVRRAGVALPLVALVAVPATLMRPQLPYVDGLVLFGLLAAFMWGERVRRERVGATVAVCGLAAVAGMVLAPSLDRHKPWLNYQTLTGGLAPARVESFDWAQSYGPLHWPRKGRAVLEVQAKRGTYWKAENLDVVNDAGWGLGNLPTVGDAQSTIGAAALRRWTQTLRVTIGSMSTNEVIAAGDASYPNHLGQAVFAGASLGTWTTAITLGPGDSYTVKTYDPQPSATELAAAGTNYPQALLPGYLTVLAPDPDRSAVPVIFPPFHTSMQAAYGPGSAAPVLTIEHSSYARAYRLAQRLARASPTPYAFAGAILRYLSTGFTYNENPPPSAYPLESFLFQSKIGYCQQFAGAMALLLRMGGVPARVAVGFTQGTYDSASGRWIVSDLNAHAWVEAWFPSYGWVRFEPTPPQDPAQGGRPPAVAGANLGGASSLVHPGKRLAGAAALAGAAGHRTKSSGGGGITPLEVAAIAAAFALLAAALRATRPLGGGEPLLDELERALARTGRPPEEGTTLASIERRLGSDTDAAGYVRALRLERFGPGGAPPSAAQRRALRAQLGAGLGPLGRLRAVWALPPRSLSRPYTHK